MHLSFVVKSYSPIALHYEVSGHETTIDLRNGYRRLPGVWCTLERGVERHANKDDMSQLLHSEL
jgi:hypothetical protein